MMVADNKHDKNHHQFIWATYNNSLTWKVRPFWDDSPQSNHDSSEGEQWGRYNLPRTIIGYNKLTVLDNNDGW